MAELIEKILDFGIGKLSGLKKRIDKNKELARKKEWNSRFNNEGYFVHDIDEELKICLYNDSVLSKLIYDGFEKDELEFTSRFLKPGNVFFDIGANIGLFSLIASRRVGNKGNVYSFEPSPVTYRRLCENIRLNKLENIQALNFGLSDKSGVLKFNISRSGHDAWNSFVKYREDILQSSIDVEVKTLLEVVEVYKVVNIDLIKLDVEGWEKFVLLGGETIFKNYSPVIMVEFTETNTYAAGYFVHELYDILVSWGYQWYRYVNGELIPEVKQLHYPYDNLIATKDSSIIEERLK